MKFDPHWFRIATPIFIVPKFTVPEKCVVLLEVFKRRSTAGHWWGINVLQVGERSLLFVGRTQGYADREVWDIDVLFVHCTKERH